jgi:E3 ubiquitin-protein ligase SHPRH
MAMHTVGQGSDQINTALLYAAIAPEKKKGKEEEECCGDDDDMGKYLGNIPGLVPKLRAYQTRAVKWMLEREESLGQYEGECPLWKQVSDISSAPRRTMHINVCTGQVSPHAFPKNTKVPGGILADEMGLGKTVELLACILANRCPLEVKQEEEKESETSCEEKDEEQEEPLKMFSGGGYDSSYSGTWVFCEDCKSWLKLEETGYGKQESLPDQYICGHCVRERAKDASLLQKQCKTTLIICPDPILEQWQEELAKHTYHGYLKVFTYLGQKASLSTGGSPDDIITAKTLSEYDVVLSTYGVLSADLHKDSSISDTFEENQKSLRHAKRYQKVPTPLTRLAWWRVCLDEAQMVHNRTAKSAEMALKLSTRYRWCVTGTPINKGLEDLYGLMVFLQLHPYDYKYWWNKLVQAPCDEGTTRGFSNLTKLLQPSSGGIMWRTRKHDVKDDLNLQPQMVKITKLKLSPVERHFYKKQHQECYAVAKAALPQHLLLDTSTGGDGEEERTLKPREAGKIFVKLLRLRQACCHPQVGSQGIRSLSQTSKPLTMDEILDMLIVKAKTDAEDILRIVIFCLNGLASVFQLENNKQDAVKAYREALQYSSTHMKAGVKTDTLQQLHTLHNLSLLLKESIPGIAPTLRDSLLESEAKDLKKEYLKNASSGLIIANSDFVTKKSKVLVSNHDDRVGQNWWIEVLFAIENSYDSASHFVDQIKSRLNDRTAAGTSVHGRNSTSFVHRFSDIGGLKYLLSSELHTMFDSRDEAMAELLKLEEECQRESPDFIYEASHCGRCRGELGTGLVRCAFCKLDDLLMRYEARIFSLRTQATNTRAVLNADDATRAQESASGFAGGWGRMAGRSVESKKGKSHHAADDLGRGARNRADKGVTHADVFHALSETEIVLDFIASIASRGKYRSVNLSLRADFDTIVKTHMALLENMRSEFKPARAYAQAQRQYIYSFDELEMAMMRMQLRAEGEELFHEHEKYFKLYESELVVRNKELSDEKIVAHSDLTRAVGTLRYLEGLRAARRRSMSANERDRERAAAKKWNQAGTRLRMRSS